MGFHYSQCMLEWDIESHSIETKIGWKCLMVQYNKFVIYMYKDKEQEAKHII
jgi:hypothetical protein